MKAQSACLCLLFVCFLLGMGSINAGAAQPAAKPPAIAPETCLSCHGPFDKLSSQTGNYETPSGEKTSPHRYVPHDSKKIPACTLCHQPHDIPPKPGQKPVKANVDWCYMGCHHAESFKPCCQCHSDNCTP